MNLPEDVSQELARIASEEGIAPGEIVRESLRDYLFVKRFRALRKELAPQAAALGISTDEDVFNRVS